jgi:hypothetical protein
MVKQDPEYLRNRSRQLHRMLRRNLSMARWFLMLWSLFFFGRFLIATVGVVGHFNWGLTTTDIWDSLLFLLFGAGFWLFIRAIYAFLLAYTRHTYGSAPTED